MPLQTATCDELVARINAGAARIQTIDATVSIVAPEEGGDPEESAKHRIRGHFLARKPSALRLTGFSTVKQSPAFDIVSDGERSAMVTPFTPQPVSGETKAASTSMRPFTTLRPHVVYDALLLQPVDAKNEIAVLEQDGSHSVVEPKTGALVQQPDYAVDVIRHDERGYHLCRKIIFDRTGLQPYEQIMYSPDGSVALDAQYFEYQEYDGALFPTRIKLQSPAAKHPVEVKVTELLINVPVPDDMFVIDTTPDAWGAK